MKLLSVSEMSNFAVCSDLHSAEILNVNKLLCRYNVTSQCGKNEAYAASSIYYCNKKNNLTNTTFFFFMIPYEEESYNTIV